MIHYHGTRLSGDVMTSVRALAGRHACVSFSDPGDVEIIAEVCQSFFFDNGAYSAWRLGKEYDMEGYAQWISDWFRHPGLDWYVIPDAIGGTEEDNQRLRVEWRNVCPEGAWHLGVPVWHMHDSLEELSYLCRAYQRVALGSSGDYAKVGNYRWWSRMAEAMGVACDSDGRPLVKLHGFRMLDPTVFSHLPLASADSTNVARNMGIDSAWTGAYAPKSREARAMILMERIESHCSAAKWCNKSSGVQQNMGLFG